MSDAIERHRARMRDALYGDDGGSAGNAGLALSALSELASRGSDLAAKEQAKKDAAKAADADAAKNKDAVAASKAATDARHKAQVSAIDAQTAMDQADAVESDKSGPQHKAAQKLADNAKLLDAQATGLEKKAALYGGAPPLSLDKSKGSVKSKGWAEVLTPTNVAIGVGGLVAVGIVYKLVTHKKHRA